MCVALPQYAMIVSELFIIYLAAAAPFGVSRFLSEQSGGAGTLQALLRAAGAALAWPYASLPRLLRRLASHMREGPSAREGCAPDVQRVEQVKRAASRALLAVEDLLEDAGALRGEAERHVLFAARECVERYTGLAQACASASAEARPTSREMELCRIAGRGGDDLLVAGRCVHRRNVTRLFAHRERASSELVQALAAVREAAHRMHAPPLRTADQQHAAEPGRVSEALLCTLSRVVELLSLFDDRATLVSVARMLDAECARAGRTVSAADAGGGCAEGEESCTTQAVPTVFVSPRLRTNTSRGV